MTPGTMAKAKQGSAASGTGELVVCRNPKAQRDYEIEERLEAGLVLQGSEVKSLRARRADLEGAYAAITGSELFLHGMHIAPYEQAGPFGHEPKRVRKLLVHRAEIQRLLGKLSLRGYTLVPLSVYFKTGRAKVELGLGRGKQRGDRREDIRRDLDLRDARDAMARGGKR
jgi:SsrA-binding protein